MQSDIRSPCERQPRASPFHPAAAANDFHGTNARVSPSRSHQEPCWSIQPIRASFARRRDRESRRFDAAGVLLNTVIAPYLFPDDVVVGVERLRTEDIWPRTAAGKRAANVRSSSAISLKLEQPKWQPFCSPTGKVGFQTQGRYHASPPTGRARPYRNRSSQTCTLGSARGLAINRARPYEPRRVQRTRLRLRQQVDTLRIGPAVPSSTDKRND
jgi:hypothetical protein